MKKQVILVSVCVFLSAICIAPVGLFFGIPIFQEWRTKQNLQIIEGAQYLLEDQAQYGGGSSQKNVYYWSDKSVEDVKRYYQQFTTPQITVEDDDGIWYIALIQKGDTALEIPNRSNVVHSDLCGYQDTYDCISVSIADASQPNLHELAVSSPSMFERDEIPSEFALLPEQGTLIIYSYYIDDF